ncbi:MAG: exosortase A [Gammaproteobacteria bacterium]|nr:MAG: exosortase A [Gammaproteobacteria bacterium]
MERLPTAERVAQQNHILLGLLAVIGVFYAGLFYPSIVEIVSIWLRSETYSYGLVVVPVSLFLVWRRRVELARLPMRPCYGCVLLIAVAGLGWYAAETVSVQGLEHFFTFAFIPLIVMTLLGLPAARVLAFPLFYLIFAVPMGDFLVPHLMDMTANITVKMLQFVGMPVHKAGRLIAIPSGNFRVEQACSGIRYLIASVAVGTLYAYLAFTSLRKRILFVFIAILLPLLANSLRAFGIIMLAHWSSMRIAVGVDHLIYGWIFFGVVMYVMFLIGNRMRGPEDTMAVSRTTVQLTEGERCTSLPAVGVLGVAVLFVLALPVIGVQRQALAETSRNCEPASIPQVVNPEWHQQITATGQWQPQFSNKGTQFSGHYMRDGTVVDLFWASYPGTSGAELIESQNRFFTRPWTLAGSTAATARVRGKSVPVRELLIVNSLSDQRLIWYWYEIGGRPVTGTLRGKWYELLARLNGTHCAAQVIAVSAAYELDAAEARSAMGELLGGLDAQNTGGNPIPSHE